MVIHSPSAIFLSQKAYVGEICKEHGAAQFRSTFAPMTANLFDDLSDNSSMPVIPDGKHSSVIGSLLFAATITRPDIALAVGILSQFVSKPTKFLLKSAMRVLAHLYTTKDYELVYNISETNSALVSAYADSDYATGKSDRKSLSGFISFVNNCPIC